MLPPDENAVVAAICKYLISSGYVITQQLTTIQRGIDVIAQHPKTKVLVHVEAKGGISSREGSPRDGKPYTHSQVFNRVAKGIFTCLQLRTKNPDKKSVRVILAIPEGKWFRDYVDTVLPLLDSAGVEVWFA